MKANNFRVLDLMVGDWVLINPWDNQKPYHPCKVVAINYNSYRGKDYSDWIDCDYWDEISPSDIAPIPLTDEILEKNGFNYNPFGGGSWERKFEDCKYIYKVIVTKSLYGDKGSWLFFINDNIVVGYYLYIHQLQHLLRLVGISKQIEL